MFYFTTNEHASEFENDLVLNYLCCKTKISLMKFFLSIIICSILLLVLIQPSFGDLESPRKQIKLGASPDKVTCNEGLVLMLRPSGMPACVTSTTAERLTEKGWNTIVWKFVKTQKEIETVPASSMSIVNFYISDHDLNLAHKAVETVSTEGLFEYTINGVSITGPEKMIETGPDTDKFFIKLELPDTVNGVPLR